MNYWRVEAGEGFSALHDDEINIDPVLRLWQRSGDMEWGDHNGVRDFEELCSVLLCSDALSAAF